MSDTSASEPSGMTIGIEEEMFLVDAETLDCVPEMPERFERDARQYLGERFEREMISSMVELVTSCHTSIATLREEAEEIRHKIARVAARHGLAVLACGTHPFASWAAQSLTDHSRYTAVAETVQLPSVRAHTCGLHVHVGVPEADRIAIMNRMRSLLPLFLALSASSPFWQGRVSGLKSYRTAVNGEFPRSGVPPHFRSDQDYASAVSGLKDAGIIPDESFIWWAIRPSSAYPTLELRICDSCTRLDDAIAIAGLYRILLHHAASVADCDVDVSGDQEVRLEENRWQAARHGIDARFLGFDGGGPADVLQTLRSVVAAARPSADALEGGSCLADAVRIVTTGGSADRQLTVYADRVACADQPAAALRDVACHIAEETLSRSLVPS